MYAISFILLVLSSLALAADVKSHYFNNFVYNKSPELYGYFISYPYYFIGLSTLFATFFLIKSKNNKKYKYLNKVKKEQSLNSIDWRQFEELTSEYFTKRGFNSSVEGGSGGDGGIDVLIKRKGKTWVVQCKHWKSKKISVNIVREMLGVMIDKNAYGAKIVTSGQFTKPCYEFAQGKKIELIDGNKLIKLISTKT